MSEQTEQERLPETVEEAALRVLDILTDEQVRELAAQTENGLAMHHFGLGGWIRNYFGLWGGNQPLKTDCDSYMRQRGWYFGSASIDPDAASGVIVMRVWELAQQRKSAD